MAVVIAIDAGTTGARALAVDEGGTVRAVAYREFPQYFPRPGWVEHDPDEIWGAVQAVVAEVVAALTADDNTEPVAAIGVANQRETVVAWSRADGRPRHRALVWQDRRTAPRCDELRAAGHLEQVRAATGLVLDPYFSASKIEWLLGEGSVAADADLAVGTVDSWLVWKLTDGAAHVTDVSNASRTLLFDIGKCSWSAELCDLFGVPERILAEVRPSSARLGVTAAGVVGGLAAGVPVSGVAGDQQAALFGQACFVPGMAKSTYGTGSFVLLNVGDRYPPPVDGLLTTVAWQLGDGDAPVTYAYEGAIFVTGAAVQWLRDGLGLIDRADEVEALAASIEDSEGVVCVPAFTGLGSPWWDPYARGTIAGITRGTGRAHIARAVLESMAFSTRDVVAAMGAAGVPPLAQLRVDGGAAGDLVLKLTADQIGVPVARSAAHEATAMGAAFLAGLAEGVWSSLDEVSALWRPDQEWQPPRRRGVPDQRYGRWLDAVSRARRWAV
ncbi:MAG: glycerol kinase GlpK [Acidimicrobiia bacterium]